MAREPFDPHAYREPRPSPLLIRFLEPVNAQVVLPWVMKVRAIDLPAADEQRLRAAVRPDTAAFLGPNHPEFLTDWLLDKEIARRVSPRMAHWAAREIVNRNPLEQSFWLKNNLIANVPGGGGKDYSVRWALAGHGVLLHPEGQPTWQPGHVGPLLPGIVDMAWEAARVLERTMRKSPVYVVPIVWRLQFTRDASAGLHREMAHIEEALRLGDGRTLSVERRFEALQWAILHRRRETFGFLGPANQSALPPHDFFEAQSTFSALLLDILESRFGAQEGPLESRLRGLRRAIRMQWDQDPESVRLDRRRLKEIERLRHFQRSVFDKEKISQEEIAATLKQIRGALLPAEAVRNMVPIAVAPRIAHLRVVEPFEVVERFAQGGDESAAKESMLAELRARMQAALDALGKTLDAKRPVKPQPNPLWTKKASSET